MNYMKDVAKMLGVEIGEEFKIKDSKDSYCYEAIYKFNDDGLYYNYKSNKGKLKTQERKAEIELYNLLNGNYEIIKLPKPILDEKEKKYLYRFIRPWRDKVEYIRKVNFDDEDEFIVIIYRERESKAMALPCFKKGTMYKGMEVGKEYSLEELEL